MERDEDYLIALLIEARDREDGLVYVVEYIGMSAEDLKRRQHVQILCDDGLLAQVSPSAYRLTSRGYDALENHGKNPRLVKIKELWLEHRWKALGAIILALLGVG